MFKIEIRNNGSMVDYDNRRFQTRNDARNALCHDYVAKRIWADMRVVAA